MKAIALFLVTLITVLSIGWMFYWVATLVHNWLAILERALQTL